MSSDSDAESIWFGLAGMLAIAVVLVGLTALIGVRDEEAADACEQAWPGSRIQPIRTRMGTTYNCVLPDGTVKSLQ